MPARVAAGQRQVGLVAGHAGIGRRPLGRADRQREGVDSGRVGRRVARRSHRLGRRAGQALVEVQRHPPVPRRRRTAPRPAPRCCRLAAAPPASRSTGSHAGTSRPRRDWSRQNTLSSGAPGRSSLSMKSDALLHPGGVPELRAPERGDQRRKSSANSSRLACHPVEERLPCRVRAAAVEPLEHHGDPQHVVAAGTATCSPQCGLNRRSR